MNRRTFTATERARCQAMTMATSYDQAHPCWYQVEAGHESDDPLLCAKHLALAARKPITLQDGRVFRLGVGITQKET
jgi:hypothetical protein